MDIEYLVQMKVILDPVQQPWIKITAGQQTITQQLIASTEFDFEFCAVNQAMLTVEHYNKSEHDPDTAVIIQKIQFFGISDPRFVWAGTYYPRYPDHYLDQQPVRHGHSYLGWNGIYELKFQVPIFTWIHQTQDLGWLYQ